MLRSQPISGEEALAEVSMLAKPTISVRAMNRNDYKHAEQLVQIDPAWDLTNDYIELEIWAYDPCLLAREGHVDPFSLYASLKENMDERIEEALEEMLEGYKW